MIQTSSMSVCMPDNNIASSVQHIHSIITENSNFGDASFVVVQMLINETPNSNDDDGQLQLKFYRQIE